MQEEVENRSVNLAISTSKLTARVLARALNSYLRHRKEVKLRKGEKYSAWSAPKVTEKKTVASLMKESDKLTNIEISDTDIAGFEKFAKKNRIDYQIKRDDSVTPPKYLVFFKAENGKDMTKAFKEYLASVMQKEKKPSVLKQLKQMKEKVASVPKKVRNKDKEQSL